MPSIIQFNHFIPGMHHHRPPVVPTSPFHGQRCGPFFQRCSSAYPDRLAAWGVVINPAVPEKVLQRVTVVSPSLSTTLFLYSTLIYPAFDASQTS